MGLSRRPRLLAFTMLCAPIFLGPVGGQDRPKDKEAPAGAPLPKGAKVRLGTPRGGGSVKGHADLPPQLSAIGSYTNATREVASRDGKRLARGTVKDVTVREADTGRVVRNLEVPVGSRGGYIINSGSAAMSADGKLLAQSVLVGEGEERMREVIVWDVDGGAELIRLKTAHKSHSVPYLSPDGKLVATRANDTQVTPKRSDNLKKEENPAIDPNRMVQVWSVESGKELFRVEVTGAATTVRTAAFSDDGRTLATSCGDGPVDLWDVPTGKRKALLLGRTKQGWHLAFSPDGKTVAAMSADGAVQRWSADDGKPIGTTEPPVLLAPAEVLGLAFAGGDRLVAWGRVEEPIVAWEVPSGKFLVSPPGYTAAIRSVCFADGGKEVVTCGSNGQIVRWSAATGDPLGEVTLRTARTRLGRPERVPVALAPGGRLAMSFFGPSPALFDLATGSELVGVPPARRTGVVLDTFYSADLTRVMTLSLPAIDNVPATCVVWDVVAQKKVAEVEFDSNLRNPVVVFSPSGSRFVVAGRTRGPGGKEAHIVSGWDLKTGRKVGAVEDPNLGGVNFAAADESVGVVVTGNGAMRVYDYEAGKLGKEIEPDEPGPGGVTGPLLFSPDGKRLAAAFQTDGRGLYGVRIYAWPSGRALHTFAGHRDPVRALAFSPDGKILATGSEDATVLLWDMKVAVVD